jgi:hypothetical protein
LRRGGDCWETCVAWRGNCGLDFGWRVGIYFLFVLAGNFICFFFEIGGWVLQFEIWIEIWIHFCLFYSLQNFTLFFISEP